MTHLIIDVSALPSTQLSNQVLCVRSRMDKTYFVIFNILDIMECKSHRALKLSVVKWYRLAYRNLEDKELYYTFCECVMKR